jgi:hypothetical protein
MSTGNLVPEGTEQVGSVGNSVYSGVVQFKTTGSPSTLTEVCSDIARYFQASTRLVQQIKSLLRPSTLLPVHSAFISYRSTVHFLVEMSR